MALVGDGGHMWTDGVCNQYYSYDKCDFGRTALLARLLHLGVY
jgi:hypothetical protein